jgi:hypothetical protein
MPMPSPQDELRQAQHYTNMAKILDEAGFKTEALVYEKASSITTAKAMVLIELQTSNTIFENLVDQIMGTSAEDKKAS